MNFCGRLTRAEANPREIGETQIFDYSLWPWAPGMKDMSLFSLIMVDLGDI